MNFVRYHVNFGLHTWHKLNLISWHYLIHSMPQSGATVTSNNFFFKEAGLALINGASRGWNILRNVIIDKMTNITKSFCFKMKPPPPCYLSYIRPCCGNLNRLIIHSNHCGQISSVGYALDYRLEVMGSPPGHGTEKFEMYLKLY